MLMCNSNMYLLTQNIGHHSTGSVSRQGDVVVCTDVGDVYWCGGSGHCINSSRANWLTNVVENTQSKSSDWTTWCVFWWLSRYTQVKLLQPTDYIAYKMPLNKEFWNTTDKGMVTNEVHKLGIMTLADKKSCQQHGYITCTSKPWRPTNHSYMCFTGWLCEYSYVVQLYYKYELGPTYLHICKVSCRSGIIKGVRR